MLNWISTNGGIIATVVLIVTSLNVVLSGIQKICDNFKLQEPSLLQKIASVLSTVTSWLTANTVSGGGISVQIDKQNTKTL